MMYPRPHAQSPDAERDGLSAVAQRPCDEAGAARDQAGDRFGQRRSGRRRPAGTGTL